jgi:plasmid stabilization system protein ParE
LSLRLRATSAAEADIAEAVDWYESQALGLAASLIFDLDAAYARILSNPLQFAVVHNDTRRVLLKRFPYAVIYKLVGDDVLVTACFHTSRDPASWKARI